MCVFSKQIVGLDAKEKVHFTMHTRLTQHSPISAESEFQSMLWLIHFWKSTPQKQTFHSNDLCLWQCWLNTICKGEGWELCNGGVPSRKCVLSLQCQSFWNSQSLLLDSVSEFTRSMPSTQSLKKEVRTVAQWHQVSISFRVLFWLRIQRRQKWQAPFWVQFIHMTFTDTRGKVNQKEKNKFCMFKTVVKRWLLLNDCETINS